MSAWCRSPSRPASLTLQSTALTDERPGAAESKEGGLLRGRKELLTRAEQTIEGRLATTNAQSRADDRGRESEALRFYSGVISDPGAVSVFCPVS